MYKVCLDWQLLLDPATLLFDAALKFLTND